LPSFRNDQELIVSVGIPKSTKLPATSYPEANGGVSARRVLGPRRQVDMSPAGREAALVASHDHQLLATRSHFTEQQQHTPFVLYSVLRHTLRALLSTTPNLR
jgi:hypothetical protein